MIVLAAQLPVQEPVRSWGSDLNLVLVLVGGIVSLVVAYLAYDWFCTRREARKLAMRRERAREAWQRELAERGG